jgi:hypothetical protein
MSYYEDCASDMPTEIAVFNQRSMQHGRRCRSDRLHKRTVAQRQDEAQHQQQVS